MVQRREILWVLAAIFSLPIGGGCCGRCAPPSQPETADRSIAVSSPYLEAALRDLLAKPPSLVRLAGPSMCPGHFDMRPSQIDQLTRCRLLVRFDFQQSLDKKVTGRSDHPIETVEIAPIGGFCVPETYRDACRQIAERLLSTEAMSPEEVERRLAEIADRMAALAEEVRTAVDKAGLRDAPVLASGHQAGFCRWLGLRCVAPFSAGDTAGAGELDTAVKAGQAARVKLIVANEPEGRRLADALADRFDARVVVFANFPDPDETPAFDNLVRRNLAALLAVACPEGGNP